MLNTVETPPDRYHISSASPMPPTPLDGAPTGASGIRISHGYTKSVPTQIQNPQSPSLKVLEILKNFFQEVFKQGLGQSPKVLPNRNQRRPGFAPGDAVGAGGGVGRGAALHREAVAGGVLFDRDDLILPVPVAALRPVQPVRGGRNVNATALYDTRNIHRRCAGRVRIVGFDLRIGGKVRHRDG